ncbi:cupin domain-containing protein [Hyphomicrobium sp. CS1GBMeth3]|uniref:cupin domain-containing protein n=1 Tax=Hyphomicrobium sp. CS1GBMeth3 TaxID=1892845 RepID=UPI00092FF040|nr:cupin domain-containing protein [Hyphomicrobium sp. CS1GBMeth3]
MTRTVRTTSDYGTGLLALCLASALSAALLFGSTIASAGECPAGKITAHGQKPGATAHKGVAEKLLGQIDLAKEKIAISGRHFRMRRLEIKPNGEVAWHSHEDRPALIYVVSGSITEYSSHCAVPIVHKAGELSVEQAGLSHWWKNTSKRSAVLISADIAADPDHPGM